MELVAIVRETRQSGQDHLWQTTYEVHDGRQGIGMGSGCVTSFQIVYLPDQIDLLHISPPKGHRGLEAAVVKWAAFGAAALENGLRLSLAPQVNPADRAVLALLQEDPIFAETAQVEYSLTAAANTQYASFAAFQPRIRRFRTHPFQVLVHGPTLPPPAA